MRYKPGQKEETRRKMLAAAGREFRSHGYAGIGVDGLAKAAGVTSGAFYAHFGSKDSAFDAALGAGLDEVIDTVPKFQGRHGTGWVTAFAEYYLGKQHRLDLAGGCAMAALTPEVVRSGPDLHGAYEEKMTRIAGLIAQGLSGASEADRRDRAWAFLSALIGGINVARAMKNARTADEIAEATKAAAIKAAGQTRDTNLGES